MPIVKGTDTSRDPRQRMYTLLGVAHRELKASLAGWCDESYRTVLHQYGATEAGGKISATTLNMQQLEQVLEHFKKLGFKPKAARSKGRAQDDWRAPRIAKLNAMWCKLADAGHVRDRSEAAMRAWCGNEVAGMTQLEWSTGDQLNRAIEMLKRFCTRCGVRVY